MGNLLHWTFDRHQILRQHCTFHGQPADGRNVSDLFTPDWPFAGHGCVQLPRCRGAVRSALGINSTNHIFKSLVLYIVLQLILQGNIDSRFPFYLLATMFIVGSGCAAFLPETLHQNLPDSVEEAIAFGEDQVVDINICQSSNLLIMKIQIQFWFDRQINFKSIAFDYISRFYLKQFAINIHFYYITYLILLYILTILPFKFRTYNYTILPVSIVNLSRKIVNMHSNNLFEKLFGKNKKIKNIKRNVT